MSDKHLLDTYQYAILKYKGKDVNYEISNIRYEIENRLLQRRWVTDGGRTP